MKNYFENAPKKQAAFASVIFTVIYSITMILVGCTLQQLRTETITLSKSDLVSKWIPTIASILLTLFIVKKQIDYSLERIGMEKTWRVRLYITIILSSILTSSSFIKLFPYWKAVGMSLAFSLVGCVLLLTYGLYLRKREAKKIKAENKES